MKTFKLALYRFFSTYIGSNILKLLSFGVGVNGFNAKNTKKHPFLVIITIDTESGHVGKNERRKWQMENPRNYRGYYHGIRNLLGVFKKHDVKATFFLSTNCFSAKNKEYKIIKNEIAKLIKEGHELGLHLHPDSDLALQEKLNRKFKATSAYFYSYDEKLGIIKAAKELIKKNLGNESCKKLVSFRWGNWALDTEGARALDKLGFKIDSSATPGIKGHSNDTMKYDWSKTNSNYPWKLSITDYQSTKDNNSNVMEMPIATFSFFGMKMRADPVNSALLNKAFLEYYSKADRSERLFPFVVISHSSEATTEDGGETQALKDLEKFISFASKFKDVKFARVKDAA